MTLARKFLIRKVVTGLIRGQQVGKTQAGSAKRAESVFDRAPADSVARAMPWRVLVAVGMAALVLSGCESSQQTQTSSPPSMPSSGSSMPSGSSSPSSSSGGMPSSGPSMPSGSAGMPSGSSGMPSGSSGMPSGSSGTVSGGAGLPGLPDFSVGRTGSSSASGSSTAGSSGSGTPSGSATQPGSGTQGGVPGGLSGTGASGDGSQGGLPGQAGGIPGGGLDGASGSATGNGRGGTLGGGQPGAGSTAGAGGFPGASGVPGGISGGSTSSSGGINSGSGSGVMTRDERVAILDEALGRGYEDFDGFILTERSRAQRQSNEVGADPSGLYDQPGDGGDAQGYGGIPGISGLPGVLPGTGPQGDGSGTDAGGPGGGVAAGQGPQAGGSGGSVGGVQGGPGADGEPRFPVPDDIPSGRDDDVVARQIREAAMQEEDPELRERLWDEYRRYTGLAD